MSKPGELLTLVERPSKPWCDWKNRAAVAVRLLLLLAIVAGIRARETAEQADQTQRYSLSVEEARLLIPDAARVARRPRGEHAIFDHRGQQQAIAITTIPQANDVIGYRGPSHCVLTIDETGTIQQVALLTSRDTPEHIEIVRNNPPFWTQFEGWKIGNTSSQRQIDAVSGATLTSLAIAKGIAIRMGQSPGSLKFPDPLTAAEIAEAWPDLPGKSSVEQEDGIVLIKDPEGQIVGKLLRTGALVDSIAGYQGPTELLVILNGENRVIDIQQRTTWDNQPYAGYLDEEPWFWDPLRDLPFDAVASANLEKLGVEGVSGATMTSMAAAETVVAAAREWVRRQQQKEMTATRKQIHWTANDIGSMVTVLIGCLIAFTKLRSNRKTATLWNILLVTYFGLVTGNLVSLVLVFGWSASGVAWQLAPGLTLVVAASFVLPVISKRNVYCSHLCPHGAAQQLLRNRLRRRIRLPKRIMRWLTWIPGLLLVTATIAAITGSSLNLAILEPFHAYIWYVSGLSSILLAVISLLWSSVEPMAWCRYGCATGRLLDYVRLSAASTQPTFADAVVVMLALTSFWL